MLTLYVKKYGSGWQVHDGTRTVYFSERVRDCRDKAVALITQEGGGRLVQYTRNGHCTTDTFYTFTKE